MLPDESEKTPDATEITPSVVLLSVGVKMAEYEEPEPEKLEREPPETKMSDSTKSVDVSESVKVSVGVSPVLRDARFVLRAMVGGVVSASTVLMERVMELLASAPSAFVLPAASENLELATEMTPSLVLLVSGVKVAE